MSINNSFTETWRATSLLLLVFLFFACNPPQPPKSIEVVQEPVEYPVGYIAQKITTNLSDSNDLFPLPEEFLEKQLLPKLKIRVSYCLPCRAISG